MAACSLGRAQTSSPTRNLRSGHDHEVLLDATLAEYMAAAIERCGAARQALADSALHIVGDAAIHPLLVEALFEGHRVDFDAGKSFGKAWSREALRVC